MKSLNMLLAAVALGALSGPALAQNEVSEQVNEVAEQAEQLQAASNNLGATLEEADQANEAADDADEARDESRDDDDGFDWGLLGLLGLAGLLGLKRRDDHRRDFDRTGGPRTDRDPRV